MSVWAITSALFIIFVCAGLILPALYTQTQGFGSNFVPEAGLAYQFITLQLFHTEIFLIS